MTILSNQIRCLKCGAEPYSAHQHDMSYCDCGNCFVDGGAAYQRIGGSDWENMSIIWDDDRYRRLYKMMRDLWDNTSSVPQPEYVVQLYMSVQDEAEDLPVDALIQAAEWAISTHRNTYGLICALARAERDGEFKQG